MSVCMCATCVDIVSRLPRDASAPQCASVTDHHGDKPFKEQIPSVGECAQRCSLLLTIVEKIRKKFDDL